MSTTTPNYGLVKPQLTDAADITAMNPNWDKIDEELKEHSDAIENITPESIGSALYPFNIEFVGSDDHGGYIDFHYGKSTRDYTVRIIESLEGKLNIQGEGLYVNASPVILANGSVPMSGPLRFGTSGHGRINATSIFASILSNENADGSLTNYRAIQINNANHGVHGALANAILLEDKGDAGGKQYYIFGQHNTELLASTLETLIANGGMSTLQSAIQTTSSEISEGAKFTGTGKGKLFIASSSWVAPTSVIIDGKNIGAPAYTYQTNGIEIEFLKSFEVNSISGNTSKFYCVAVFY